MNNLHRFFLVLIWFFPNIGECQIFSQNFESSTVLADYVSSTPNSGQFNAIGTSGAGVVTSISGMPGAQALKFARTANAGIFSRTTDFSPVPNFIRYQIDLEVPSTNGVAATSVAGFQVGSAFGTGNSGEANASVHSRFTINFTTTTGEFVIRDVAGSVNGVNVYSGQQTIVWFINNTGSDVSYLAPNGTTEILVNDKWDLWVGMTKEFDDRSATTATQTLTDLKFYFTAGVGTINIHNLIINQLTSLPIELLNIKASNITTSTLLSFSTASERNNDFFAIERSNDGRTFDEIGQVKGAGTSQAPQYYTFTDKQPLSGKNYYRLRQVDFDGKVAYSAVVNVVFSQSGDIRLAPSPATDLVLVQLDQPATEDGLWQVFDVAGRLVQSGNWAAETDMASIHVGTLAEGMYTFRFTMGQTVQVKQFRKQ